MRRAVRVGAALVAAGALVVATGGVASAKSVSNEKYVKQLCVPLSDFLAQLKTITPPTTFDAATQQKITAQVDASIASLKTIQTNMAKLTPADGGKKVAKLFDTYLAEYQAAFQKARDTFAAANPSSPAFSAAFTVLAAQLAASDAQVSDPFSKLRDNQDLTKAFKNEKACKDIVEVH